jgi:hypothetical protein
MNAEYIGEKSIVTVGFAHEPGAVLTMPAGPSVVLLASLPPLSAVSLPALPSLLVDAGVAEFELLPQPAKPAPRAKRAPVARKATAFRLNPSCMAAKYSGAEGGQRRSVCR